MSDKTPSGRRKANKAKVKGYVTENRRTDTYVQYGGLLAIIIYGGYRMSLRGVSKDSCRLIRSPKKGGNPLGGGNF